MKVGDIIYVDSAFYIDRGEDDVVGGKATVTGISTSNSAGKPCVFVTVKEHPHRRINWDQHLALKQGELRAKFGNQWAYEDPDYGD